MIQLTVIVQSSLGLLPWKIRMFYISAALNAELLTRSETGLVRRMTLIWNSNLWDCLHCSTLVQQLTIYLDYSLHNCYQYELRAPTGRSKARVAYFPQPVKTTEHPAFMISSLNIFNHRSWANKAMKQFGMNSCFVLFLFCTKKRDKNWNPGII